MFAKFDSVKTLKTLIKLAAVALTSPATIAVASSLYPAEPVLRVIVSAAALTLVEGCLLLGWQMLDQNGKNATMAQRWLYAGLAWVAYFSLFMIALSHNEGLAGLTFRLTLGVMLIYASVEAGLLAGIKREDRSSRDILTDWRVKRHARNLARQKAVADLNAQHEIARQERDKMIAIESARIALEKQRGLAQLKAADTASIEAVRPRFPMSIGEARRIRSGKRAESRSQAFEILERAIGTNPGITQGELARLIGKSRQSVGVYLAELSAQGRLVKTSEGKYAIVPSLGTVGANGNGRS